MFYFCIDSAWKCWETSRKADGSKISQYWFSQYIPAHISCVHDWSEGVGGLEESL
jgi:hypothetical protein